MTYEGFEVLRISKTDVPLGQAKTEGTYAIRFRVPANGGEYEVRNNMTVNAEHFCEGPYGERVRVPGKLGKLTFVTNTAEFSDLISDS